MSSNPAEAARPGHAALARATPRRVVGVVAALLAISSGAAFAADRIEAPGHPRHKAGEVIVRGRIMGVLPYDESSTIDLIGGRVHVPPMILPDVDLTVFLGDRWSVTGQTGALKTRIKLQGTRYGDFDFGTVWDIPASLAVQYHFRRRGRVETYVGAGLVANWYFGEKPAGGFVQDFKVSSVYAPLIKAGLDYRLNDKWLVNAEVRQIFVPTQTIENDGVGARTRLKTVTTGVGIGYRF